MTTRREFCVGAAAAVATVMTGVGTAPAHVPIAVVVGDVPKRLLLGELWFNPQSGEVYYVAEKGWKRLVDESAD